MDVQKSFAGSLKRCGASHKLAVMRMNGQLGDAVRVQRGQRKERAHEDPVEMRSIGALQDTAMPTLNPTRDYARLFCGVFREGRSGV
jgi:hypothetical protein